MKVSRSSIGSRLQAAPMGHHFDSCTPLCVWIMRKGRQIAMPVPSDCSIHIFGGNWSFGDSSFVVISSFVVAALWPREYNPTNFITSTILWRSGDIFVLPGWHQRHWCGAMSLMRVLSCDRVALGPWFLIDHGASPLLLLLCTYCTVCFCLGV